MRAVTNWVRHGGDLAARGTNDEQVRINRREAFDLCELRFEYTLVFLSRQAGEVVA